MFSLLLKREAIIFFFAFSFCQAAYSNKCFDHTLPFFLTIKKMNSTPGEQSMSIYEACQELQAPNIYIEPTVSTKILTSYTKIAFPVFGGQMFAAFSKLGGTHRQNTYRRELERIKKIPNPIERIKLVYELVLANQGDYDEKASINFLTPNRLLNLVDRKKSVGVCRDRAALLQWSLMQVSRFYLSKGMALEQTDFSSQIEVGILDGQAHAWVRVNLPNHNASGMLTGFTRFDLDTTFYPYKFSILFPRKSGLTTKNWQRLKSECTAVRDCLNRVDHQRYIEEVRRQRLKTAIPKSKHSVR